jgi:hypothetical protein
LNLTVKSVPITFFHQTWPLVEHFFVDALKWGGDDYTLDQIKTLLSKGEWLLLVAADEENNVHGAAAVSFINMPNDRIGFVTAIGGKLISSKDTYEQLTVLLKSYGATKIQGAARESIARLWTRYGFKERYRIVEAKI